MAYGKFLLYFNVFAGETVDASPAKDTHSMYKVGDKVKVILEEEVLKPMQEGHGGWNPRMAEVGSHLLYVVS